VFSNQQFATFAKSLKKTLKKNTSSLISLSWVTILESTFFMAFQSTMRQIDIGDLMNPPHFNILKLNLCIVVILRLGGELAIHLWVFLTPFSHCATTHYSDQAYPNLGIFNFACTTPFFSHLVDQGLISNFFIYKI
jgi:hypothetical protein